MHTKMGLFATLAVFVPPIPPLIASTNANTIYSSAATPPMRPATAPMAMTPVGAAPAAPACEDEDLAEAEAAEAAEPVLMEDIMDEAMEPVMDEAMEPVMEVLMSLAAEAEALAALVRALAAAVAPLLSAAPAEPTSLPSEMMPSDDAMEISAWYTDMKRLLYGDGSAVISAGGAVSAPRSVAV